MKPISRHTRDLYMRTIVSACRQSPRHSLRLNDATVPALIVRKDFANVLYALEGLDLLSVHSAENQGPYAVTLTPSGIAYFERRSDERCQLILRSIVIPVIVALLTTMVTVYTLPPLGERLKRWLAGSSELTQQSSAESLPTCAPCNSPE